MISLNTKNMPFTRHNIFDDHVELKLFISSVLLLFEKYHGDIGFN